MNTLGTYHNRSGLEMSERGGCRQFVCVCLLCLQGGGVITLSGKKKRKADNSVCSIVLSIRLELKVAGGKNTFSGQSGKQSVAGKLQISTKLSGPWQNDNYCSLSFYTHTHTLKVSWSTQSSAQLDGSFISILNWCLFSCSPRDAVVMLTNLLISIEGMQSGRKRVKEKGGGS